MAAGTDHPAQEIWNVHAWIQGQLRVFRYLWRPLNFDIGTPGKMAEG